MVARPNVIGDVSSIRKCGTISMSLVLAAAMITTGSVANRSIGFGAGLATAFSPTQLVTRANSRHHSRAVASPRQHHRMHSLLFMETQSGEGKSETSSDGGKQDLAGKVVYRRSIYHLSSAFFDKECPYTLEERVRYKVQEDKKLKLFGSKTFLIRGPPLHRDAERPEDELRKDGTPRRYIKLGPKLYAMDLHEVTGENDHSEEGNVYHAGIGGTAWDSSIACALYFLVRPELMQGKALELGSGVGLGGVLSPIAAGLVSPPPPPDLEEFLTHKREKAEKERQEKEQARQERIEAGEEVEEDDSLEEDVLPHRPDPAPLPYTLESITLTDINEQVLSQTFRNCRDSGIPADKVVLSELDWKSPVHKDLKNNFDLIMGSDIAYQFPDVAPISRLVAYALKPNQYKKEIGDVDELHGGHFFHVGPKNRNTIFDLKQKLMKGYKMNCDVEFIKLEKFDLVPLILDSADVEEEADTSPNGLSMGKHGYVEYQAASVNEYQTLRATHHEDYDGTNGEWFFPTELGTEDRQSREKMVEKDTGYTGGPGGGRWKFEDKPHRDRDDFDEGGSGSGGSALGIF